MSNLLTGVSNHSATMCGVIVNVQMSPAMSTLVTCVTGALNSVIITPVIAIVSVRLLRSA